MAKLYVFGIGGTGSRVIKSLTMLLASGVKSNYDIVPIIIDPDNTAGDLNRTAQILRNYQNVRNKIAGDTPCDFFKTPIQTLNDVMVDSGKGGAAINGFKFELDGVANNKFRDFIGYNTLDDSNRSLIELLFSEHNLNASLEVGFKGNPNIGSVVLNQFTKSQAYKDFATSFQPNDRIFIISSIFGGTGAAGFPLILKNIRQGIVEGNTFANLQNARIGAVTVMPYFKVKQDENSEIDSHNFITKTKAALNYYATNVTGNNSINSLYYIGDTTTNSYENQEGGNKQKNDAHFVEVASALSIIDFANTDDTFIQTENGKAINPTYKEYGLKDDVSDVINFQHFHIGTEKLIKNTLTRYFYFDLFLKNKITSALNHPYAESYTPQIDTNFLAQPFFKTLEEFNREFRIWLGELNRNQIAFKPFKIEPKTDVNNNVTDFSIGSENIFTLVNEVPEKGKPALGLFGANNYELYISKLNEVAKKTGNSDEVSHRFMQIFSKATELLISKKLY